MIYNTLLQKTYIKIVSKISNKIKIKILLMMSFQKVMDLTVI